MFDFLRRMDDDLKFMIIGIPLICGLTVFTVGIAGIILFYLVKFFGL